MTGSASIHTRLVTSKQREPDGVVLAMRWVIDVDGGPRHAGPAGLATLIPAGSGLRAQFDYSEPGRLLALDIPCGSVAVGDTVVPGRLSELDAALVDVLLGTEIVGALTTDRRSAFFSSVEPKSAWAEAGKLAFLQTVLSDEPQPLEGIWAAEAADIVANLGTAPPLRSWGRSLVQASAPALRLLRGSLMEERLPPQLKSAIIASHLLAPDVDLGAIGTAFAAEIRSSVSEAETWLRSLPSKYELAGTDGNRMLKYRGSSPAVTPNLTAAHQAQIDYSAEAIVDSAMWQLVDNEVVVTIELNHQGRWPESFSARTMVRVASISTGVLLVAGLSTEQVDGGRFQSKLPLPVDVGGEDDLLIYVGRHLGVEAITSAQFELRQSIHATRAVIAQRRPKFLAEQAADFESAPALEEALNESRDPFALAGARSLAWGAGRLVEAAGYEKLRLTSGNRGPELTIEESDRLIGACVLAGADDTALTLDRYSREAFYEASS